MAIAKECFGHATRNILILACTEVEAHWKKILEANGYENKERGDRRLNTKDYVHLLDAMRLDQYVVNLNYYPWLSTASSWLSTARRSGIRQNSHLGLAIGLATMSDWHWPSREHPLHYGLAHDIGILDRSVRRRYFGSHDSPLVNRIRTIGTALTKGSLGCCRTEMPDR
jgi:hypothetical protein